MRFSSVDLTALHKRAELLIGARTYKLIRYVISGGTAALVNWAVLFLLVEFGSMYYLYASILAFVVSIAASFTMHKFWTFQDKPVHDIHVQFSRYAGIIFLSLLLNTVLVYLFVDILHIWYLLAQVAATVVIAVTNFFAYRRFVFRERGVPEPTDQDL